MGGLFSKPEAPGPDPELQRLRAEQRAELEAEKKELEEDEIEETRRRELGKTGFRSLLGGGGLTGFNQPGSRSLLDQGKNSGS